MENLPIMPAQNLTSLPLQPLDERLQDKWWRLTNLYKIKNKDGQLVTFKPNSIQLKHLAERREHRYNYVLKFRQGGFTTLYAIDLLDEALWVPGTTCAIIAHEAKKLPEYFNVIKRAFVNLPDAIKPSTKTDTKHMYEFVQRFDGAQLDSSIYVAVKLRGGTVQKLHITESAYIKDRQELKSGSKQAVPLTGSISEETTGNGFNEFFDDYESARLNPNPQPMDYKAYFYSWVQMPEYTLEGTISEYTKEELEIKSVAKELYNVDVTDGQLLWRRWKMNELKRQREGVGLTGDQLFKQEYPLTVSEAFQSGAGNVFDTSIIDVTKPPTPITKEEMLASLDNLPLDADNRQKSIEAIDYLFSNEAVFFKVPELNRKYTIGVDPSDGNGSDHGAVAVWLKNNTAEEKKIKVAEFYGKLRPDDLAYLATQFGQIYNHSFIGVENNMLTCALELSKIYDNYYSYVEVDKRTEKRTKKYGWNTNSKTRNIMIDDFIKLFEEDELDNLTKRTLSEMKTFVKKENGKREHADGKFDDMLFADFIAIQLQKYDEPLARVFATKPF